MKGMATKGILAAMAALMIFGIGCTVVDDDCCEEVVYYQYWEAYGPDINTLEVGGECCVNSCTTWSDYDWSIDTLGFTPGDADLVDLQLDYTLTNWGNQTTLVWVSLCDDIGCEDVIEIELLPGEVYWERTPNPVLDSAMDEYFDCLYYFDDYCWLDYEVEVWLGEEYTCVPVTMDYNYEALYMY